MMRVHRIAAVLACGAGLSVASCNALLGDYTIGNTAGSPDGGGTSDGAHVGPDAGGDDGTSPEAAPGGDTGSPGDDGATATESGAADAEAGAPWTPAVLDSAGELAVWLEASSSNVVLSSGTVGVWKDLSSHHNDASTTQTGPAVDSAAVKGHDAVHFTARGMLLTINDAASLQFGADQIFIEAVAKGSTGYGYFFSKVTPGFGGSGAYYVSGLEFFTAQGNNDAGATVFPGAHVDGQSGNEVDWPGAGLVDGQFHRVAMRRSNATTLSITVDDQPPTQGTTGSFDVSQSGKAVNIGGVSYGTFQKPVDLDIAEMLVLHSSTGIVGDADVANVQAYLKQKYGL